MATVAEIQEDSQDAANSFVDTAVGFIRRIENFADNFTIDRFSVFLDVPPGTMISSDFADGVVASLKDNTPTRPWDLGYFLSRIKSSLPTVPTLQAIETLSDLTIPTFDETLPSIDLPDKPEYTSFSLSATAPAMSTPEFPDAPVINLPQPPSFTPVEIPAIPEVQFPYFTATEPVADITAPTSYFAFSETEYNSDILDALREKLLYDLENGGYGIEPDDEARLWNRARDRELAAATAKMDNLSQAVSSRGLKLPPVSYIALMQEAEESLRIAHSSASREIAINKADLYMKNRQFTIQSATELERVLIQYQSAKAERALNAARSFAEFGIAIFDAQVRKYNAALEGYKVAAQVYEANIRAAISKVEVYKARIEAAKLSVDMQQVQAGIYVTRINGINALINLYKTEMEACKLKVEVDQSRIQAFKTEVEAYLAQVQAKNAEFQMYKAAVDGELAKINVFEAKVKAYATNIAGLKARTELALDKAKLIQAKNEAEITKMKTQLTLYTSEIEAAAKEARAATDIYTSDIEKYRAEAGAVQSALDLNAKIQIANAEIHAKSVDQALQNAKFAFEGYMRVNELGYKASETGANIMTNLGVAVSSQLTAIATKAE